MKLAQMSMAERNACATLLGVERPRFSLVVPVYNEQGNIAPMLDEIFEVLASLQPFEVLFVDDSSTDSSLDFMRSWKENNSADWLRIMKLEKNSGQSAAVLAGAQAAASSVIATLDGDMQNDPRDLVSMLSLVESGEADGVTGVRVSRRDTVVRKISSRVGNAVRNLLTGDQVRDAACGIKVIRRDIFLAAPRFNGMHRFMATLARYAGATIIEVPVNHRERHSGMAKYGIGNRALRGLRDCSAMRWYRRRVIRPRVAEEF